MVITAYGESLFMPIEDRYNLCLESVNSFEHLFSEQVVLEKFDLQSVKSKVSQMIKKIIEMAKNLIKWIKEKVVGFFKFIKSKFGGKVDLKKKFEQIKRSLSSVVKHEDSELVKELVDKLEETKIGPYDKNMEHIYIVVLQRFKSEFAENVKELTDYIDSDGGMRWDPADSNYRLINFIGKFNDIHNKLSGEISAYDFIMEYGHIAQNMDVMEEKDINVIISDIESDIKELEEENRKILHVTDDDVKNCNSVNDFLKILRKDKGYVDDAGEQEKIDKNNNYIDTCKRKIIAIKWLYDGYLGVYKSYMELYNKVDKVLSSFNRTE